MLLWCSMIVCMATGRSRGTRLPALGVNPGALWLAHPDLAEAWAKVAGAAGQAQPGELDEVVAEQSSERFDSGLERALLAA